LKPLAIPGDPFGVQNRRDPNGVTDNSQGFQPLGQSPMPILLFDIDGTLVRTGGAGKAAMEKALQSAFGVPEIRDVVPYSGRTDRAIARDLLTVHGIDPTPANQAKLQEAYLAHLPASLTTHGGVVCPGIG